MGIIRLGCSGWDYRDWVDVFYKSIDESKLHAYSRIFNTAEINSTFYSYPSIEMVRSWRRRVPKDFMFSVRCHKDLTHKFLLSPRQESYGILNQSLRICNELKAEILNVQTPPSFSPEERLKDIRDLLSLVDFGSVRLAWEIRGRMGHGTIELMSDLGIIHCTDISREMPVVDSDILYTRLFGQGEHNLYQFDDAELSEIDQRVKEKSREREYLTFHGARMYSDAARLKVYEKSGTFPKVTKAVGLESLKAVLEEDAKFPAAKLELMEKQGWKAFDLTETEHVHASVLLGKLPDRRYGSVEEVIRALK